jgi:hypothetical protein
MLPWVSALPGLATGDWNGLSSALLPHAFPTRWTRVGGASEFRSTPVSPGDPRQQAAVGTPGNPLRVPAPARSWSFERRLPGLCIHRSPCPSSGRYWRCSPPVRAIRTDAKAHLRPDCAVSRVHLDLGTIRWSESDVRLCVAGPEDLSSHSGGGCSPLPHGCPLRGLPAVKPLHSPIAAPPTERQ